MKPNYKNWLPKGMLYALIAGTAVSLVGFLLFGVFGIGVKGGLRIALGVIFAVALLVCGKSMQWCGCGSGALTIACAKRNPQGRMVGLDRWGKEYASFSLPLCQNNAKAENVSNTEFRRGDATKLDFPDESFDAVTSNYVYHNITGADKQQLLLEKLRVLKKGGAFAIHDLMSQRRYGDMQSFVKKLRDMGYERVELIDLFWWRNTKRIRFSFLPEKEIYQNPAKHIGSFVRGIPLFAVIASLSVLIVVLF